MQFILNFGKAALFLKKGNYIEIIMHYFTFHCLNKKQYFNCKVIYASKVNCRISFLFYIAKVKLLLKLPFKRIYLDLNYLLIA